MNPTKYYYVDAVKTLFYMNDNILYGIPMYGNGLFDREEAFIVEEGNSELGEEHLVVDGVKWLTQLKTIWAEARQALS